MCVAHLFMFYLRNRSAPAVNCGVIIHCLEVSCKENQITSAQFILVLMVAYFLKKHLQEYCQSFTKDPDQVLCFNCVALAKAGLVVDPLR